MTGEKDAHAPSSNRSGAQIFWTSILWTVLLSALDALTLWLNPDDYLTLGDLITIQSVGYSIGDVIIARLVYFVPITFPIYLVCGIFVHWFLKLTDFTAAIAMIVLALGGSTIANAYFNPLF